MQNLPWFERSVSEIKRKQLLIEIREFSKLLDLTTEEVQKIVFNERSKDSLKYYPASFDAENDDNETINVTEAKPHFIDIVEDKMKNALNKLASIQHRQQQQQHH